MRRPVLMPCMQHVNANSKLMGQRELEGKRSRVYRLHGRPPMVCSGRRRLTLARGCGWEMHVGKLGMHVWILLHTNRWRRMGGMLVRPKSDTIIDRDSASAGVCPSGQLRNHHPSLAADSGLARLACLTRCAENWLGFDVPLWTLF